MKSPIRPLKWSCAVLLAAALPASAQTDTWNGLGSDANWSTAGNWTPGAPNPGDSLIFDGATQTGPINDFTINTGFGGIQFAPTAATFTLTGNAIWFAGTVENDATNTLQTIALPMVLTNSTVFNTTTDAVTSTSANLEVAALVSGSGSLTKNGNGTLTLDNISYSGGTTVNGGLLVVSNNNGNYTMNGGSLLLNFRTYYSGANISFTANSSVGVDLPDSTEPRGVDAYGTVGSSSYSLTKIGEGILRIVGSINASSIDVAAGELGSLGGGLGGGVGVEPLTKWGTAPITVENGAMLRADDGGVCPNAITLNGGDGVSVGSYAHYGALISSSRNNGSSTTNFNIFTNTITLTSDSTLGSYFNTMIVSGNITGSGTLTKIGASPLLLSGSNSYTGSTLIMAGTLQLGSSNALPATSTVTVFGTSTLDINGSVTTVGASLYDDGSAHGFINNSSATPATLNLNGANLVSQVKNTGAGLSIVNVSGTAQLLGVNSYTGSNIVQAGTLEINIPTGTGGLLSVADNATLTLHKTSPGSSLRTTNATFGTSGATTLNIDLANYGNSSAPIINATNGTGVLSANGTLTITFNNTANLSVGQFPIIKYGSRTGTGSFVLTAIGGGITAQIVTNNVNKSIDLQITSAPITTWKGSLTNNLWDASTLNWTYSGSPTLYSDGDAVFFDDTALTNKVNLTTALSPGSVLMNSTNTYTFNGTGPLNGGTLTKNGSGTLIMQVNGNGYSSTTIGGGTLQIGNNDGNGDLGSSPVDDEASLTFNRSNALTVANSISGAGQVIQNNTNTTTLSVANTYTGGTLINQGVLKLGNNTSLGVPSGLAATVASGASLDFGGGGHQVSVGFVSIAGNGVSSTAGALQTSAGMGCRIGCTPVGPKYLSLAANASIGDSSGDFQLGIDSNANGNSAGVGCIDGQGFILTKIGNNTLVLEATNRTALSQFVITAGGIDWANTSKNPLGTTCSVVISNNAFIDAWDNYQNTGISLVNNFTIGVGGARFINDHGTYFSRPCWNTFSGAFTLNGNLNVTANIYQSGVAGQMNFTGPISGAGGIQNLCATNAPVTLSGANTYTGATVVSNTALLQLSGVQQGGGSYLTYDNSTLDVPSQSGYTSVPMSTLMVGSANGAILSLNRLTVITTNAPIIATNLTAIGTNIILLPPLAYATPGQYPLIKYTAFSGGGTFVAGAPGVRGTPGTISNNVANGSIDLVVPSGTPVVWTGNISTNWDINTTANWKTNSTATTYQQSGILGDSVTFDDSSSVTNVYLASPVSPTIIIVNNTNKLYSFSGSNITSAASLLKQGTGTLLLTNGANTFTGGATIVGGTVKLGNAGSFNNSSGALTVAGNGCVDFNNQQPTVLACTISGTGFNGLGTLVQNSGANNAYGPGSITLAGSATVGGTNRWDLRNGANKLVTPTNAYTLTKVGTGFNPVFVGTAVSSNLGDIYITAGSMGYESGTTGLGNPTNTIYISTNASLEMYSASVPLNKSIVLSNGAAILPDNGGGISGNPYLGLTPTTVNILSGPIYLPGPAGVNTPAKISCNYYNACAISNTISGPGGLVFDYNAYNRLYATNTYTGDTTINGGVYLYANACIVSTNNIVINVGPLYVTNNAFAGVKSTFLNDNLGGLFLAGNGSVNFAKMQIGGGGNQSYVDASARTDGTFTLPTNSLVYSGSAANNYIKGNLVVTTNSTLSVGNAGSVQVLSCSNNVTFQAGSTNYVDVNKTATVTNCDLLNVTGTLNFGGTLQIRTNGTVPLAANDSFKLFAAGSISGTFAVVAPSPGPNLMWDFSQLAVNGTLSVKAIGISPASTNVVYGNNVQLVASTTSGGTLTYQWYDNNANAISGANSATLTLVKPPVAASGNYTVSVTNGSTLAGSAVAQVTVTPAALTVTATNINKNLGATYTFNGTEFVSSGLVTGDSISSVSLSSAGAPSGAVVNTYPIIATNAVGAGLANYNITYVNGTLTVVQTLPATGTNITFGVSGSTLTLTWPTNYIGWLLQSNSVALANTNYWFTISNSVSTNQLTIPVNPALTNVFFRMLHP